MNKSAPQDVSSVISDNGSIYASEFTIPFSSLASSDAAEYFVWKHRLMKQLATKRENLGTYIDEWNTHFYAPLIQKQNSRYSVHIKPATIGGIYTEIFTPAEGVSPQNDRRILINLHGGGFYMGAITGGQVESIPIAATGRIKVISVDYRQAPDNCFPSATQDVVSVYTELLKDYKPENIGIYGCSAGAFLTSSAIALLQRENIPLPGAIGLIGAAAGSVTGDSAFVGGYLTNMAYGPPTYGIELPDYIPAYFKNADPNDPVVAPVKHPTLLAEFPPALLITGTRSVDMSFVVYDHAQLVKAGVETALHVWEAMDHCFLYNPDLQESREAYQVITNFFNKYLKD
jgi:epsilon-lactone hydrolase